MGLDLGYLRQQQKAVETQKKQNTGDYIIKPSKLPSSKDIRILPPIATSSYSRVYFAHMYMWWIGNTKVICNSSPCFNMDNKDKARCVIQEEIDAARKSNDPAVMERLNAMKPLPSGGKVKVLKKQQCYMIPFLDLTVNRDTDMRIKSVDVNGFKVLEANVTLFLAINGLVISPNYMNDSDDNVLDQKCGRNFTLKKTGTGKETKYSAEVHGRESEIDASWYSHEHYPDVFKQAYKHKTSDAYQRSLIRAYLYGEKVLPKDAPDKKIVTDDEIFDSFNPVSNPPTTEETQKKIKSFQDDLKDLPF